MSASRRVLWALLALGLARAAAAQEHPDASVAPSPRDAGARPSRADAGTPGDASVPRRPVGDAGVTPPRVNPASRPPVAGPGARSPPMRNGASTPVQPLPPEPRRPRDPCDETLRAAQFDDIGGAERAYAACRRRMVAAGHALAENDVRTLEDVTTALHAMRRADGQFCIAPAAPFELGSWLGGARDVRACLSSLDRVLGSEENMERLLRGDAYASARIQAVEALNPAAARRSRRGRRPDPAVEAEMVNLARLVGRQYMRTCRCMPGPQPDSAAAVRAMRLPATVEGVLLRGLQERGDPVPTP